MSIDLSWETLTAGPDGEALAEKIRDFVHEKFQTVTLPRFIKSVKVHGFEFGSIAPQIELKDICDPLPDFYEKIEDDFDEEDDEEDEGWSPRNEGLDTLREQRRVERVERTSGSDKGSHLPPYIETGLTGMRPTHSPLDTGSPFLGVNTPGIPGGTSNLNYFRSQLATGLSGTHTPLAAVAGAHLPNGWADFSSLASTGERGHRYSASGSSISPPLTADEAVPALHERASISTLATTATRPQTREGLLSEHMSEEEEPAPPPRLFREPRVEDLQTVFRVRYSGDVKLSLTAEILLDYPMPSFVGIPLMLNITGLSFDGVAVLAYIRKRAHFCFLSPEDAYAAVGPDADDEGKPEQSSMKMGGLFLEIKVESEIGQRGGKAGSQKCGKG